MKFSDNPPNISWGTNSPRAYACQVQRRRRRWPERPDFTGIGSRGDNGATADLQINQSTLVPVLVRSARALVPSRSDTQQRPPVSQGVVVKHRHHVRIPKNHPLDREKTRYFVLLFVALRA